MLTTEDVDFKRFLKSSPDSAVSAEERNAREAYRYSKVSLAALLSCSCCSGLQNADAVPIGLPRPSLAGYGYI